MSLRDYLRAETAALHGQLDTRVEPLFTTLAGYCRYLAANHAFRTAIEPVVHVEGWTVQKLGAHLLADLADLKAQPRKALSPLAQADRSTTAGRLYVLEGSAVGARLLYRQALSLGLDGQKGARHLHAQQDDRTRWRAFVEWLDGSNGLDWQAARAGAVECFAIAGRSYD